MRLIKLPLGSGLCQPSNNTDKSARRKSQGSLVREPPSPIDAYKRSVRRGGILCPSSVRFSPASGIPFVLTPTRLYYNLSLLTPMMFLSLVLALTLVIPSLFSVSAAPTETNLLRRAPPLAKVIKKCYVNGTVALTFVHILSCLRVGSVVLTHW